MTQIEKGVNPKTLAVGAVIVLVGVAAIVASTQFGWTVSLRRLELPGWALPAGGAVVALAGLAFAAMGFGELKCSSCGAFFEHDSAYFPLELEEQVLREVGDGTPSGLLTAPDVPQDQMKMAVEVEYCPKCKQIAQVGVVKWQDYRPHQMVEGQVVRGEAAARFAELAASHEKARAAAAWKDG